MAKMKIASKTPLVREKIRLLYRIAHEWYQDIAKENDVPDDVINNAFVDYASMSCRVSGLNGDCGFELASVRDSSEEVRRKFEGYLNTDNMAMIDELVVSIRDMDSPFDDELAPDVETDDPE